MAVNPANDATGAMADLADALLDFQDRPGRHAVALREPRVLFERITEVLALASGRSVEGLPADPQAVDALRDAARFFVRTALLRPGADHFSLLGLSPGFDPATLREHYRMLIRMTHPDFASAAGVAWPADAATRINLANDVLSSDERREAYAQSLQRPRTAGGPAPAPARWAKDPWHAEPSGKRWPAVAAGVGVVALLGFWLWPSQTPQERLARLAAEAQEQELAAQQAAKEAQAAQVAAAAAAPTPAASTQTALATAAKTRPPAPAVAVLSPTASTATPNPATQPTPPAPPPTIAQARPAPAPSPAPVPSRATDAPTAVALAAGGTTLKLAQAITLPPERVAAARPSPVAQQAAALESPARTTAMPVQAVTAQRTFAAPTPAPAAALAPSPAVVVAASAPSAAPPAAPAPAPAQAAQHHGVGGSVPVPAPPPTVAAASPPAAAPNAASTAVATAQAAPVAPAAERVAAAQPAPVPSPARNAGNSPRMSEVQPLLNQLLGALQSGRGDAAVRLIDTMARQSGAGAGFSEAYERTLGGGRLLRIGQVQFAGRPTGDQLVVDGVLQLQVQENGQEAASREFVLRAAFVSRGGQPVLTQLSPAGTGR